MPEGLLNNLYIFVLAMFTGFEVITKVPPLLHTPLMSGSNAISGISVVGALVITAAATGDRLILMLGVVAVAMGMINVMGGFLVTDRMLEMFKGKKSTGEESKS
jgi:NAD(P) transhydrogenase subunit alpha